MRPIAAISRERERAARGPLLPPWLIIAGVIVAILVVLEVLGSNSNNSSPPKNTTTPVTGTVTTPTVKHHPRRHRHKAVKPPATTVKLELVPTGPVYVCVTDQTGKKLISGITYSPGQTIPTVTAPKLLVNLGNNGVNMKVNGVPYGVTASSTAIDFSLSPTATGPQPLASTQAPNCG
jgi:hypothetical protein